MDFDVSYSLQGQPSLKVLKQVKPMAIAPTDLLPAPQKLRELLGWLGRGRSDAVFGEDRVNFGFFLLQSLS
ncbi:hypothetical protein [Synechococcus elongatus]|uniref:hypothetical protein n=1 Tax=Synechococcus elongatus TaxID=32046 RepID=UPI0030D3875A